MPCMVTPSPRPTSLLRMRSIRTSQEFWGHTQPTSYPQTWRASLTEVFDFQDLGRFSAVCVRMAALTNGFASFEGETRRSLPREASTDSVFSATLPHVPELEIAKHSHPLLGKNGTVVHSKSTAPAASSSLENRSGAARECLGTKIIFWKVIWCYGNPVCYWQLIKVGRKCWAVEVMSSTTFTTWRVSWMKGLVTVEHVFTKEFESLILILILPRRRWNLSNMCSPQVVVWTKVLHHITVITVISLSCFCAAVPKPGQKTFFHRWGASFWSNFTTLNIFFLPVYETAYNCSPFKALEAKVIGGVTLNHLSWAALGGGMYMSLCTWYVCTEDVLLCLMVAIAMAHK